MIEIKDRPYIDYPNPIIVGNTFYRIGQRGVFCVHARGEIFNNIFSGNVKAVGMEKHSRPLFHHNVCYFNNVPMAINRSEPLVFNNVMMRNQWGQRMLRGANPIIFGNVTHNSPFFRDFDEFGRPIPYATVPGTGDRELDPGFVDPLAGDFSYSDTSPLKDRTLGFSAIGIMRDPEVPQPLTVQCKDSYGREVLSMTPDIIDLIEKIDRENNKLNNITAAYTITYTSYLDIKTDKHDSPDTFSLAPADKPVVHVEYTVDNWSKRGSKRSKKHHETVTTASGTFEDSGEIIYNGRYLRASSGRFAALHNDEPDPLFIGERPYREAPGGFYRDYDQYCLGAAGPTGTFYNGYLRIMGGKIDAERADVGGHSCIVVRYPHIGKDQYFYFFLDPTIGYRPRKIEQYFNETLCRTIDGYRYKEFSNGINMPVEAHITDISPRGSFKGQKVAETTLTVDENSLRVNE